MPQGRYALHGLTPDTEVPVFLIEPERRLGTVANRSGRTKLATLHLPKALRRADLVVSMPKLKTHHWAGLTASMKSGPSPRVVASAAIFAIAVSSLMHAV